MSLWLLSIFPLQCPWFPCQKLGWQHPTSMIQHWGTLCSVTGRWWRKFSWKLPVSSAWDSQGSDWWQLPTWLLLRSLPVTKKCVNCMVLHYVCPYLSLDNLLLLLLLGLLHHVDSPLSLLLGNLLGLNCCRVVFAKWQLCDGHIIKNDIEISGSICQLFSYQWWNLSGAF